MCCVLFFLFFKQKTAYEMRISDWSSDVCSSDLGVVDLVQQGDRLLAIADRHHREAGGFAQVGIEASQLFVVFDQANGFQRQVRRSRGAAGRSSAAPPPAGQQLATRQGRPRRKHSAASLPGELGPRTLTGAETFPADRP